METSLGFTNLLKTGIKKVFFDEYLGIESMIPQVFNVESSDMAAEEFLGIGGGAGYQKFDHGGTGMVHVDSMDEQYKVTITHDLYTDSFVTEYTLVKDDKYGVIKQKASKLGELAKLSREQTAMDLFNHLFDTTYTGGDGLALCSTAHTSKTSGVANLSNSGTSSLSRTSFDATRLAMRKFYDWQGNQMMGMNPDTVIIPIDLETSAIEAFRSQIKDANNTINAIATTYKPKILILPLMTDTNNWAMADSRLMKKHLHFFNREPVRLINDSNTDTLAMKTIGLYRISIGFSDFRWIYGHNVS